MYVCMYVCMYRWMDGWMHACMHACMNACMYVCIYVCMYYILTEYCGGGTLAYASSCFLDADNNRPLAGFTNICPTEVCIKQFKWYLAYCSIREYLCIVSKLNNYKLNLQLPNLVYCSCIRWSCYIRCSKVTRVFIYHACYDLQSLRYGVQAFFMLILHESLHALGFSSVDFEK